MKKLNKEQEDLHQIRKSYINLKRSKRTLQLSLKDLRSAFAKDKKYYTEQLKTKRLEMLNDKEARDAAGFSNNKSWESEIKKRTTSEEIQIEDMLKDKENSIKDMEEQLEILNIDIEDLKLTLMIDLEFVNENKNGVVI